jgi:enoyl-[acyl-carrier protein] reductase II
VSNEGGLGVLAVATMSPDEFEAHVVETKNLTDRPFAVNFPIVLGDFHPHLEMVLSHGVKIIFVSAGSPRMFTARIHEAGALCVHVVPSLKLALGAETAGVDALVLEGGEAGGHVSADNLPILSLVPPSARALKVPFVAAGGIVDGHGMAAAMCLGAHGVQMGTRFLATHENNAHPVYKEMLLKASESDATVYSRLHHPGRALRSPVVEKLQDMERKGHTAEEIRAVIGRGRARKAAHHGDVQEGIFFAGCGAGAIHEILTVHQVFESMLDGYQEALENARRMGGLA